MSENVAGDKAEQKQKTAARAINKQKIALPIITCSNCKSGKIVTDGESGEVICANCGQVIYDNAVASQPEWRSFTLEEVNDRARTGVPTSLARHDMGLNTVIGRTNKDASGRKIDATMRNKMERLRAWDNRSQTRSSAERSLQHAFSYLTTLRQKSGLPDPVVEKTAYIYRKAVEKGLTRGRTVSSLLTAATYIACREMGVPRTLDDMSESSGIKLKEVARAYRLLVMELDLKIPMADPMKCIVRIANRLNIDEKIKRKAFEFMKSIENSSLSAGKDPMGLAAAVVYITCQAVDENRSQTDIADAAGVTEVTVRNRSKSLKKFLSTKVGDGEYRQEWAAS